MSIRVWEDPKLKSSLENITVYNMILQQKDFNIPNLFIPHLINGKDNTIRTIEYIRDRNIPDGIDESTGRYKSKCILGGTKVFLVFDYNNQLKEECLHGKCNISVMDSIASISVQNATSYQINYFFEMSNKIQKYVSNIASYEIKNANAEYQTDRISESTEMEYLTYDDMLRSQIIIPSSIRDILSEAYLVGGNIQEKEISEVNVNGRNMKSTSYVKKWRDGLLTKLQYPDF